MSKLVSYGQFERASRNFMAIAVLKQCRMLINFCVH